MQVPGRPESRLDHVGEIGSTIVELENLTKSFGKNLVLDGVTLSVERGSVTTLIGPSGAGKSTLLRCVNLLEKPDSGKITVLGQEFQAPRTFKADELQALRRRVGMVFQSFNLFPHMTALKNVTLPQMRVLKTDRETAEANSRRLLERVGLSDKADAFPAQCSGGQQQRIAIARALALSPDVMLFDEPTSSLDPELGLDVLEVMRELAAEGMTMIVVTHEMQFAKDVSDHLVVMADCQIIEQGIPAEILSDPKEMRTRNFLRAVLER